MSNTQTVYRYDAKGYYIGTSLAQLLNNELLLPSDCTKEKPTVMDGYWSKLDGSKWTNEKIPTSCAECIEQGLTCISNGQGQHNYEVKILLESLVSADLEHYKIVISSDFVEQIEEIPPKTLDEVKSEKLSELTTLCHNFDDKLVNNDMYVISSLGFKINADIRSQNNLKGLISVNADTVNFIDYNNEIHKLTQKDLNTLLIECSKNGENLYMQKWTYAEKIKACKTIKELEKITFDFVMLDFSEVTDEVSA